LFLGGFILIEKSFERALLFFFFSAAIFFLVTEKKCIDHPVITRLNYRVSGLIWLFGLFSRTEVKGIP
jgi:hypothetical protein